MKHKIRYGVQILAFFAPSFLKKMLWRCIGFKIGERVKVGMFSLIMVDSMSLADDACIDPLTLVVFLKEFRLGEKCRIAFFTKIYGRGIFVAESRNLVSVQCLIECSPGCSVTMKDYACFGPRNTLYTHGEYLPRLQYPTKRGGIVIGEYSWTGMSTVILPGTTIGAHAIITPGAVLCGNIPGDSFIKSSAYHYDAKPIDKKLMKRTPEDIRHYLNNVLTIAMKGADAMAAVSPERIAAEPDLLFQNLSATPPELYKGKRIMIYEGHDPSPTPENMIIAGYDLPQRIKKLPTVSWVDFKNYLAWPRSDKILSQLVNQLYLKLEIRFLFIEKSPSESQGTNA